MATSDLFKFDKKYLPSVVAGVDEAGRGPLAGPVVCAACIMPLNGEFVDKINDSKALDKKRREQLCEIIKSTALDYCITQADHNMIDAVNILNATRYAMKKAIEGLSKVNADIILVDAVTGLDIKMPYCPIIKGDALSYNIAAASILAKVYRDNLMADFACQFSGYGFETNMGYGTKEHIEALKTKGPCQIHRRSFIKNFFPDKVQVQFDL